MAVTRKYLIILIIGLPLAAIIVWLSLVAFADGVEPDDAQEKISSQTEIEENEPQPINAKLEENVQSLDFSLGSLEDLHDAQLTGLIEKIESVPGVADKTKVWIAIADVASAPGQEEFYHIKGPLTCGRAGCELVVMGEQNGTKKIFLETIGETIDAPELDILVINKGTNLEVVWEFNGEEFVEK